MIANRIYLLAMLLLMGCVCFADSADKKALSAVEYRAQLDQLLAGVHQLDSSGHATPAILRELPPSWHVSIGGKDFVISTENLRDDIRSYEHARNIENATAIESRIQTLRSDLDGFEASPPDVSHARTQLNTILSRPEFHNVSSKPTFLARLQQKILGFILKLLRNLFGAAALPTVSRFFIYGLIFAAVMALGFLVFRQLSIRGKAEKVVLPDGLAPSAKAWSLWLADAQTAAANHDWREAIHLAYWAGISFLEHQGTWRPDKARTPREYLRLLSQASEHRDALTSLTRIFELTWYAKHDADAGDFLQTMQELERLGCRSS